MARAKSKATITVADGAGGMVKVQDRRFETGDWLLDFQMPPEHADAWLRYFTAECEKRGWSSSYISQAEPRENSGSITVNTGGADKPPIAVIWDRKRGGRSVSVPVPPG